MNKRQQLSPTFAVVPNQPVQPTVTARQTVTQTVVVRPTPDADDIPHPILTGVRPELSGVATPTPSSAAGTATVVPPPVRPNPTVATPVVNQPVVSTPVPSADSIPASVPPPVPATTSTPVVAASSNPPVRSSSTTSSSSASGLPSGAASNTGATTKGISPTVIGVVAGVIALAVVCAVAFFVRRRFLRRRSQRRNTWGAGYINDRRDAFTTTAPQFEKQTQPTSQPYGSSYEQSYKPSTPASRDEMPNPYDRYPAQQYTSNVPAPPPMSFNNPQNSFKSPPPTTSQLPYSSKPDLGATDLNAVAVLRVFIPSLPDELHIAAGERVRIINAYDDGWALCANSRGEQGVVPLECLDQPQAAAAPQGGDWRNLKRASSLYSTGAPASGY